MPFRPLQHGFPNMNYANMIEEKNLKRTFIIATLISTIIGTFTTSMNLYERVGEKRKQKRTDDGQDAKIKELQKQIEEVKGRREESNDRSNSAVDRRRTDIRDEDARDSLARGGPAVGREYDRIYRQFGDRFAEGDVITQNQLQGQIITLQSSVIKLLEEALYTGRSPDINKLYNASELARDGSIAALQQQYQRMLEVAPLRRGTRPSLLRRTSSTPTMKPLPASARGRSGSTSNGKDNETKVEVKFKGPKEFPDTTTYRSSSEVREVHDDDIDAAYNSAASVAAAAGSSTFSAEGPLFCRYATSLQDSVRAPLDPAFAPGGSNRCPECSAYVTAEQGRAWKIVKEVLHEVHSTPRYDEEQIEERTYLLSNRFVIKCHRERVGFACVLCARFRHSDTIVTSAQGLVKHVWRRHNVDEYEVEPDIREIKAEFHSEKAKYAREPGNRGSRRMSPTGR